MDKEMTYGQLHNKFCEKYPELKSYMSDYRPAGGYSICIWFDNGMDIVVSYNRDKDEFKLISRQ